MRQGYRSASTVYAVDDPPRAVATFTLPAVPAGTRLDGIEVVGCE